MAIIYKIATVEIVETLTIRGFAPPPPMLYRLFMVLSSFLLFFSVTYLKKNARENERKKISNFVKVFSNK